MPDTDAGSRRVAILGAGPVGLDAALACLDAGVEPVIYEAGPRAGTSVRAWGHVRLFTPWSMNVSARMRRRLGRAPGGEHCPTGNELVTELLEPLAAAPELAGLIRYRHRVTGIARAGLLKHEHIGDEARTGAPFRLLLDTPAGERTCQAEMVLDATGVYTHPNTIGDGGHPRPRGTRPATPDHPHPAPPPRREPLGRDGAAGRRR
jgi:NADPH-dependent 2,4-dienoyl-CoA reductase/sulfur reductase-like enzyme